MDDCGRLFFIQKNFGEETYDVFTGDKFSRVIEEKAAIKVSIPSDAQISSLTLDCFTCLNPVLPQKRVWDTGWEV